MPARGRQRLDAALYQGCIQAPEASGFGAVLAGLAFVLPSFCMVVGLGALCVTCGGIGWMQAVFYGVGAAVIGIIAMSAYKLTTKNIGSDRLLWAIFSVSAAVTVITKSEIVWLFLGAGGLVWLLRAPPKGLGGRLNGLAISAPVAGVLLVTAIDWPKSARSSSTPAVSCLAVAWRSCPSSTVAIALVTVAGLWRFKKMPEPVVVLIAAIVGLVVQPLMARV